MSSTPFEYCDLHTHLLPGIDDGCQTLDESLACLRELALAGCRQVVCTPHMGLPQYQDNVPGEIETQVTRLREIVVREQIDIEVLSGGEFRLVEHAVEWWSEFGVPVLGESNVVLVDTWEQTWASHLDQSLEWLQSQGFQPVLAHPERMRLTTTVWSDTVRRLLDQGVLLQGNFKSFGDHERPEIRQRAQRLLADDAYSLLASDSHAPGSLPARWSGLAWLQQTLDAETLRRLVWQQPRELMADADVERSR